MQRSIMKLLVQPRCAAADLVSLIGDDLSNGVIRVIGGVFPAVQMSVLTFCTFLS
jgi:hypothetical protein